jgi:uncharacterized protein (TIGR02594 family)
MVNDAGRFAAGCALLPPHTRRFSQGFPSTCLNSQGLPEMKFVARAAVGLVLIAAAAPTAASANNAMDFYNQPEVRKAMSAKGVPHLPDSVVANRPARTLRHANLAKPATAKPAKIFATSFAGTSNPHWISVARQYKGTNPTGQKSLWCADFMNFVLARSGLEGTSSRAAGSFASYGQRLSGPKVGAIAVIARGKSAGHVGIVTGIDPSGNPILISGNHNNTVAEAAYPRGRVMAYVWPVG